MRFNCPSCGKSISVKPEMAGKKGRCPACKALLTVPSPTTHKKEKSKTDSSHVICSGCGRQYPFKKEMAGKRARCKSCGTSFVISDPARIEKVESKEAIHKKTVISPSLSDSLDEGRETQTTDDFAQTPPPLPDSNEEETLPPIPDGFLKKLIFALPHERTEIGRLILGSAIVGAVAGYFWGGLYDPLQSKGISAAIANFFVFGGWGLSESAVMLMFRNFGLAKSRTGLIWGAAAGGGAWVAIFSALNDLGLAAEQIPASVSIIIAVVSGGIVGGILSILCTLKLSKEMRVENNALSRGGDKTVKADYKEPFSRKKMAIGCGIGCLVMLIILIAAIGAIYYFGMKEFKKFSEEFNAEYENRNTDFQRALTELKNESDSAPLKNVKLSETWVCPVSNMEFVFIKGGCYEMGCGDWTGGCENDEKPVHQVCLSDYYMGRYEVTLGQWKQYAADPDFNSLQATDAICNGTGKPMLFNEYDDTHPMCCVSLKEAKSFAAWLSQKTGHTFRIPSEAQWEFACRSGGRQNMFAGGTDPDQFAWFVRNSNARTHPVGQKAPNSIGIYDMNGNVTEWCLDDYHSQAYETHSSKNPLHTSSSENELGVVRGGSWFDNHIQLRCSERDTKRKNQRDRTIGFRLIREIAANRMDN